MHQQELQERRLHASKIWNHSRRSSTKPSDLGELNHPEMIFLGIDGGVDSYIAREAAAGNLPNFARLLKRGTRLTELRTAHPSITPTCWSSIITGTTPEIHGVIADRLHNGGKLTDTVTSYNGKHLMAERFWDAAVRAGKSALVSGIPLSGPSLSPQIRQCGGFCFYRFTRPESGMEFYDIPMQLWFFDVNKKPSAPLKAFADVPQQKPSSVTELSNGRFRLEMTLDREPGSNYRNIPQFHWELRADGDGFTLFNGQDEIKLLPDRMGEPFFRDLPSDAGVLHMPFRFGCYEFDDGFLILSDVTGDLSDVCSQDMHEITKELPPPPLDKAWTFFNSPATAHIATESCDRETDWQIEMLRRALSEKKSDIVVTYFPWPDTVNHFFWQAFSKCIDSTPEIAELTEYAYRETYATADRYLGFLLDEVADENTTFLIASDHGSLGHVADNNVNDILNKAGLLFYDDGGKINLAKTRAACVACGHIWVNLQGREDCGIVPQEKYEDTVYEIIAALQDHLRGPDGRPFLAFAVRKEEAGFFGLGGPNCGDVVFGLTAGYAAMTIHAEQIPSARSQYGNMLSLGILSGPHIAEGKTLSLPCRTVDLAPTLCELLNWPRPQNSIGVSLVPWLQK